LKDLKEKDPADLHDESALACRRLSQEKYVSDIKTPPVTTLPTIVFIQKSAGRGGAKNRLWDTLKTLKTGMECQLHVVTSETGEFTERCAELGVPVTVHPLPEWRKLWSRLGFASAIKSLAKKLPFTRADWVISNEMWWAPHAAALARCLDGKSAAILRDGIADAKKARKYRLQDNDLILPSSMKIARGLNQDPELGRRTHVFLDAVLLPPRRPESTSALQARLSSASPEVKRWLLVIGRVQERKRQADAVRVLRGLMDRGHRDLGLVIAGDCDAEYLPVIQAALHECQVEDRVVMLGNFSDIQTLFSMADICLLTSLREALPGSMMESCLAGIPCFMYPCEGAEDIFGPHQENFVSETFEPAALVEKVDTLLRNPDKLSTEAAALQKRAQGLFSMEAHLTGCVKQFGLGSLARDGASTLPS
jgi:glycosyltransferase involved in cell wall biosynthesis